MAIGRDGRVETDRDAAAVSPQGGGGRDIAWYELPDALVGFIAGGSEGYVVTLLLVAGLLSTASLAGPKESRRQFGGLRVDQLVVHPDRSIAVVS